MITGCMPCCRAPQLQWRARAGISPAFLFFPMTFSLEGENVIGTPHAILFPFARLGYALLKVNESDTEFLTKPFLLLGHTLQYKS